MNKHAIQPIKYHLYFQTISRANWWFILEIAQNFHRIRRKAAWYAIMKTVNCLITVWNSEEIYSLFSARTSIHEEWRFECNGRKRAGERARERKREMPKQMHFNCFDDDDHWSLYQNNVWANRIYSMWEPLSVAIGTDVGYACKNTR